MPSFTIKVPNGDEGEDLGEYQADYLPRVGDPFVLWHPRVCLDKHHPFYGVVSGVTHEAFVNQGMWNVATTVWLIEEHGAPTLYCQCTEEDRANCGDDDDRCGNCGHHVRSA